MRRVLVSVGLASVFASLALSGDAGAESRSSQASIRLTGVIEMRANYGSTLTFSSRAKIDTTLRVGAAVGPVIVPMEYEWKGVQDSCSFAAAGADGEMRLQVFAVGNDGRPSLSIYGSPPSVTSSDCNYSTSPSWRVNFHRVQSGVSQKITPTFNWGGTDLPGTGTIALTCPGCAGAGAAETAKKPPKVLWFYDSVWTPNGYKGGGETVRFKVKRVAVVHNGIATGKVAGGRCEVFYTRRFPGALLKRLLVPGKWTLPSPRASEGSLTCSWKRPKGYFGLFESVNPGIRYQGAWYHMSKKALKGAVFRHQLLR